MTRSLDGSGELRTSGSWTNWALPQAPRAKGEYRETELLSHDSRASEFGRDVLLITCSPLESCLTTEVRVPTTPRGSVCWGTEPNKGIPAGKDHIQNA